MRSSLATANTPYYKSHSRVGGRLHRPICLTRSHRSRIAEGEGGWADEQRLHLVTWDDPALSPHSLRSGQALSVAKGLSLAPPCHPERSEGSLPGPALSP